MTHLSALQVTAQNSVQRNKHKRAVRAVYYLVYGYVCIALVVVQLFIGTNIWIALMALGSLLLAGIPLSYFGWFDIAALFAFGLLSKYSVFPFFIKTFMGERIDVGLLAADKTFPVILAGSLTTVVALFLAKSIHIRKRLLNINLTTKQWAMLGNLSFVFGFIMSLLHILLSPRDIAMQMTSGFGGFGGFTGFLYIGVICTTAHLTRTHSRKIIDIRIVLMLAASLFLSLISNAKLYITLSLFAYLATFFFFGNKGGKVLLRYVAGTIFLGIFYAYMIVPVIQVLRTDAFKEATVRQRITIVTDFVTHNIFQASSRSATLFNYAYYPKFHTPIIDRLEMVQDLDLVLAGITASNTIGWEPIPMALIHITPSFLTSRKVPVIDVDLIAYKIDYIPELRVIRRTLGIFGVSYAMLMWPGWVGVSFMLIFLFLLLVRKLVPDNAAGNIFGIYLVVQYGINFSEIGVENLISLMLRAIPMDIITILILVQVAKFIVKSKRRTAPIDNSIRRFIA